MIMRLFLALTALFQAGATPTQAASFDLAGPPLKATVTRGRVTLPIGQVPQFAPGDRLQLLADLPPDQLRDRLVVVAFLRGAASPPPKNWFFRIYPDKRNHRRASVVVPQGAQQAIVLLAPNVAGGYPALVSAVRGRPGIFVRAAQDMGQASLDRARVEAFVDAVHALETSATASFEASSVVLARNLAIRWNADCLQRDVSLQAACLTQNREALILHDGRGSSLTETLTGAPAELAYRISATPQGGSGYYNPYIGLVRDVVRLFGGLRTAQFQYIPALTLGNDETLRLLLNTAPSFRKPHSVIVAPLRPVQAVEPPAVRTITPDAITCASRASVLLPAQGAPILYATGYARKLSLRFATVGGEYVELPVLADAERGGIILPTPVVNRPGLPSVVEATLHGDWGFESFTGPRFRLQVTPSTSWQAAGSGSLVVGRNNELVLEGGAAACVERVSFGSAPDVAQSVPWKVQGPESLSISLPLQASRPGSTFVHVTHAGAKEAARVPVKLLEEASRIERFAFHAGEASGVLNGTRLDQVASLKLGGASFDPGGLERVGATDKLFMASIAGEMLRNLKPGQKVTAAVKLKDGRALDLPVTVERPRPRAVLVERRIEAVHKARTVPLTILSNEAVPQNAALTFSVRAEGGTRFSGAELLEVSAHDGSATSSLKAGAGLTVVDAQMLVARIDLSSALGPEAFGPTRFRLVANGVAGDWQPLAALVRLPSLSAITCEGGPNCTLTGTDLFLIDSIASTATFEDAIQVPAGYIGTRISVPVKGGPHVFLRLRDAARVAARASLPDQRASAPQTVHPSEPSASLSTMRGLGTTL